MYKDIKEFTSDFIEKLRAHIESVYGEKVDVSLHTAYKTNTEKEALTVSFGEGSRIRPTIYPEDFYDQFNKGISMDSLVEKAGETIYKGRMESPELPVLTPEEARKHIRLVVVNTVNNQVMLADTPNISFCGGELSAYPRWYISDEASFRVSKELCSSIGLTPDEVLQMGQQNINNMKFTAIPLGKMIAEMTGVDDMLLAPDNGPQMIVVTNENRLQGASCLLSEEALNMAYSMAGERPMAICPSSVHEIICIPITEGMDPDDMRSMIREVNETQVAVEDRLSGELFMYNGHSLSVVGDSFDMDGMGSEPLAVENVSFKFAM